MSLTITKARRAKRNRMSPTPSAGSGRVIGLARGWIGAHDLFGGFARRRMFHVLREGHGQSADWQRIGDDFTVAAGDVEREAGLRR